ncbi:uncharacterized protein MICPUCDRAFT_70245 [Micromonas pusilla CCMP1545]|uniref:Uncharacterized protein n=1 Tax=Micromonas pusilla (strain CCMP1545) TaxID=564608 RepID=C1MV14_MICPC|nr:uncharacterized protein MICPUCDRAFT_70245 [Micromonas pusilla CCMP1545]EEH56420.1 hypothetical protein MICPUCDRAFT_70245 [Micromonas pusilla CCMP1545]|eukprot:XP_003059288.1 hypothetical protein MICPUCDRAFT_70245 [Micromonas pusilla CCMP1545]
MPTPTISPPNLGPPAYISSFGFFPRPSFSARARRESPRARGTLRFKDAHTGVDVLLVGTMHYNPASIELAAASVRDLSSANALRAIVLETCPTRWAKTRRMQPRGSFLRMLLDNEFQAAVEARDGGDRDVVHSIPIVLGDQKIEDLGASAKATLRATWEDFSSPFDGGWARLWRDFAAAYAREVDSGPEDAGLSLRDLATDAPLALGLPVSFFRYPLAWSVKSPKVIVPFAAFAYTLSELPNWLSAVPRGVALGASALGGVGVQNLPSAEESAVSILFLVLDVLEVVFLSSLFLKALLATRNDVLSRSIRETCVDAANARLAAGSGDTAGAGVGTVVAVLGAAHLNGVQRRLMEDASDGRASGACWTERGDEYERAPVVAE